MKFRTNKIVVVFVAVSFLVVQGASVGQASLLPPSQKEVGKAKQPAVATTQAKGEKVAVAETQSKTTTSFLANKPLFPPNPFVSNVTKKNTNVTVAVPEKKEVKVPANKRVKIEAKKVAEERVGKKGRIIAI